MKIFCLGIVTLFSVATFGAVTGGCSEKPKGPEGNPSAGTTTPLRTSQGDAEYTQTLRRIESELRRLSETGGTFDEKKVRAKLKSLSNQLDALLKEKSTAGLERPRLKTDNRPIADAHPFASSIHRAKKTLARMDEITDYSAIISKRERINGKLLEYETMFVKIRHKPFSVYMKFLGPAKLKGREVIYVEGQNDGNLIAHEPRDKSGIFGFAQSLIPTVSLQPTSVLAMQGNRYPITEIGVKNLLAKLIEVGEQDMKHGEAEAKFYADAKVNDRPCEAMRFKHPTQRDHFRFNIAEVFFDKELDIPIRYAAYSWPKTAGGSPILLEEYTYSKVKLNNGFDDEDFNPENPEYAYSK